MVRKMANISQIKNKDGVVTGYRIRVFKGEDLNGKKQFFSKNWTIPKTYKSEKAIQTALAKVVSEFEVSCKRGEISTDNHTFSEFSRCYIETKDLKPASERFYKSLLPLTDPEIGMVKLKDLTPQHLDRLYKKLLTSDVKRDAKATPTERVITLLKDQKIKRKDQCIAIGISENTLRECLKQNHVSIETAEKISAYLKLPQKDLFEISTSGVGLSAKYVGHVHSFICSVLEFALKRGYLSRNVALQVTPPKRPKKEAEFFELEDIQVIREALKDAPLKYQIATYLLIDTGMRRGELVGLRWSSIDLENCTIKIENNVQYLEGKGLVMGTPKSGHSRTISIAPELVPMLEKYKQEQKTMTSIRFSSVENVITRHNLIKAYNPEGYLFIQESGKVMNPNALNQWMLKLSKEVGLHIHPHKFRHGQASLLIAAGVDVVTVSKRLGHAQVSTTQNIYSHLLEKSDKDASDTLSALIFKNA